MKSRILGLVCAVVVVACCLPCEAGTQDFLLVNDTGVEIYSVYVSETNNENWEEDVMGWDVLPYGGRVNIGFSGRRACLWDLMVTDGDDNSVTWTGINLCEVSTVILRCNQEGCWADTE